MSDFTPRTLADVALLVPNFSAKQDQRFQRRLFRDARRRQHRHHRLQRSAGGGAHRRFS